MRMAKIVFHFARNHAIMALAWLLIFASVRPAMEVQRAPRVVRQTSGVNSVKTNVDVKMAPLVVLTMELVDTLMDIKDRIAERFVLQVNMAPIVQIFVNVSMARTVIILMDHVLVSDWPVTDHNLTRIMKIYFIYFIIFQALLNSKVTNVSIHVRIINLEKIVRLE